MRDGGTGWSRANGAEATDLQIARDYKTHYVIFFTVLPPLFLIIQFIKNKYLANYRPPPNGG